MDHFTQLQDPIISKLDAIKAEQKKLDKLKDLSDKEVENCLTIGLIQHRDLIADKLFRVLVKVCDVYDLYKLNINDCGSSDYYVVEVHASKLYRSKLFGSNWYVCVRLVSNHQVSKIQELNKLSPGDCCKIVISVDKNIKYSEVETMFFTPSVDNYWPNMKISNIPIDISYYFVPLGDITQKPSLVYEIGKLYTDSLIQKPAHKFFEYKFSCKTNLRSVLEVILQNCYHKLDLNQLQCLTSNTEVTNVHLNISGSRSTINLDTNNKTLTINSNYHDLCQIKRCLISNLSSENYVVEHMIVPKLKMLYRQLNVECLQDEVSLENLKIIYEEYKELIAELPL